jgi:hypothetical protein
MPACTRSANVGATTSHTIRIELKYEECGKVYETHQTH